MSLPDLHDLSEREQDILRLVATGAGNKQIAALLFISTNTVKVHLRNIFAKIGVTSRTEAAMVAVRLGLVESAAGVLTETTALESSPQDIPVPVRTNRSLIWGVGAGLFILFVVLGFLAFPRLRSLGDRSQDSITPAPQITPLPRWQILSDMPSGRMNLAVVAYDNHIYAIGGETTSGVTGAVEQYDSSKDTWEAKAAKPLAVADIQAVVLGGKIYIPGGRTSSGSVTNVLEIFDPNTNLWEQGADLPVALSAYALGAFEGRMYLFGGWNGKNFTNEAYLFDPRVNNWSTLTPMPTPRGYARAALAGGKIFVIGGKDSQGVLPVVEVYSPDHEGLTSPWQSVASLPAGRFGMGIASVADIIYVVGGQGVGKSQPPSLAYIPQTDTWQSFENPPTDLGSGSGMALSGEFLYVVGGNTGKTPLEVSLAYQVVYTVGIPVIIK